MPQVRDYAYFYDSPEVTSVASHPLDEVLGDAAIDVILMDIEGSEYSALGGMQRISAAPRCYSWSLFRII